MEDVENRETVPALFEQCLEVYEAMKDKSAHMKPYPDTDEEMLVYEGFLTRLITKDLNFSNPYYTKTTKRLKEMGCIHQIKRGGSTTPSKWALLRTPTIEHFRDVSSAPETRPQGWRAGIEQQIRDLNNRLSRAGI